MQMKYLLLLSIYCFSLAAFCADRKPVTSLMEFREKNVVIQEWDLSCGAAVLTSLLRYQHGIDVTEKQVASAMIKRDEYMSNPELVQLNQGFSLLDLKRFVESMGLQGAGFGKLAFNDLLKHAPIIVPVQFDDYNHFVIFRGAAGSTVLLADPAWGNRTLARSEFEKAWLTFGDLGKIGFVVKSDVINKEKNQLIPTEADFVMLR